MSVQEEFEILKSDYIQKSQVHLKELQDLQIEDFDKTTCTVDVVLTQHTAAMSFLSLSMFILEQKKKRHR